MGPPQHLLRSQENIPVCGAPRFQTRKLHPLLTMDNPVPATATRPLGCAHLLPQRFTWDPPESLGTLLPPLGGGGGPAGASVLLVTDFLPALPSPGSAFPAVAPLVASGILRPLKSQ